MARIMEVPTLMTDAVALGKNLGEKVPAALI
jgi:hypothetical protein